MCSARFPTPLGDAARRSLTTLGVEVRTGSMVTAVDAEGVTWRSADAATAPDAATSGSRPRPCCGRPAWRRRRWPSRSACRSIAPAVCWRTRRWPVPGHPEIFVVGDICALEQDGQPLPGRGAGRHAGRRARRAERPARDRGTAARAVPLSRLREHGDDRPRLRGRRHLAGSRRPAFSPGCSGCSSTSSGSSDSATASRCCPSGRGRT